MLSARNRTNSRTPIRSASPTLRQTPRGRCASSLQRDARARHVDGGAERPAERGEALEDRAALVLAGEPRTAALVAWLLPAEADRDQLDRAQLAALPGELRQHRFPVALVGREAR